METHKQQGISTNQLQSMKLAKAAGCSITKDGNKWCCLWGENIQEGIAGFGDTPLEAICLWAQEFGMR